MDINIQFVKISTSESMEAFAIKKLNKLAKKYDFVLKVAVFYKLEKNPKGKEKICEMELSLAGPRIFASSKSDRWDAATDETIRDLEKQLKKRKQTMKPHL